MAEMKRSGGPPPIKQHVGYEVRTTFQAGYEQYASWKSGNTLEHAFGWFHPFGKAEYYIGTGFDEEISYRDSGLLNPYMMSMFDSKEFCVYKLNEGLLFAWELGFGNLECIPEGKRMAKYTIVVGGTGRFQGATAVLQGKKETVGCSKSVENITLPRINITETCGVLRIPDRE